MNEVCKFDCLTFYPGSTSCYSALQYKGVVSTCAFVMHNKYRDTFKYADGLLRLSQSIDTFLPGFILRIFADVSIQTSPDWAKTLDILRAKPYVQIVFFTCPKFFDVSYNEHFGVFGTLIRTVPMFEDKSLPNWVTVPEGVPVLFTDIDFTTNLMSIALFALAKLCIETDDFDIGTVTPSASMGNRHKLNVGTLPKVVWAGSYICKVRFPITLLTDFLNECTRNNPILLPQQHEVAQNPILYGMGEDAETYVNLRDMIHSKFYYGIDEFFLAWVFRSYLLINPIRKYKYVSVLSIYSDKQHLFFLSEIIGSVAKAIENSENVQETFSIAMELLREYNALTNGKDLKILNEIKLPNELIEHRAEIINLNVAKASTEGLNTMAYYKGFLPQGQYVSNKLKQIRNFYMKLVDSVIRGKIAMHYIIFQNLLETIRYCPDGSTSIWRFVTHEVGQGESNEIPTSDIIKNHWNNLTLDNRHTVKKSHKTVRKTRRRY